MDEEQITTALILVAVSIPAIVAKLKGRSFILWLLFSSILFPVAAIACIFIRSPNQKQRKNAVQPANVTPTSVAVEKTPVAVKNEKTPEQLLEEEKFHKELQIRLLSKIHSDRLDLLWFADGEYKNCDVDMIPLENKEYDHMSISVVKDKEYIFKKIAISTKYAIEYDKYVGRYDYDKKCEYADLSKQARYYYLRELTKIPWDDKLYGDWGNIEDSEKSKYTFVAWASIFQLSAYIHFLCGKTEKAFEFLMKNWVHNDPTPVRYLIQGIIYLRRSDLFEKLNGSFGYWFYNEPKRAVARDMRLYGKYLFRQPLLACEIFPRFSYVTEPIFSLCKEQVTWDNLDLNLCESTTVYEYALTFKFPLIRMHPLFKTLEPEIEKLNEKMKLEAECKKRLESLT